jgi:hypothetical protein
LFNGKLFIQVDGCWLLAKHGCGHHPRLSIRAFLANSQMPAAFYFLPQIKKA